jgi:hypothetical protein
MKGQGNREIQGHRVGGTEGQKNGQLIEYV